MHQKLPLLLEVAIEPKTAADASALAAALQKITANNIRLDMTTDRESGQTILQGTTEAVLEEALSQLEVEFNSGAPQVAYRETLSRPLSIKYTHKRQTGGSGQFAEVTIEFEPLEPGSGFVFENEVFGGAVPKEFIPAVEKGLKIQKESGLLAGFPVIDFKAKLVNGKYHEVDSTELAFDIAARAAFRELVKHDAVQLAEPIMKVVVVALEDVLGGIIGDINCRRGQVLDTTGVQSYQLVIAQVPLANMFGYQNTLNSMCRGHARYLMEFDHYEPIEKPSGYDPTFPGAMAMRVA